ncbi:MAG TPA: DUF1501 domain-containing protein [Pirellulaceae bacterium]|nr:DUF1501 domain-containing protein [Pirellulaceae bacterium]
MLAIHDARPSGLTRRQVLAAGAMGGGLSLAGLLRAESAAGIGASKKAVINVHLDGGPPHLDMIDLKPDAPSEIRGEFSPIATRVPGIQICEHLPRLAAAADKLVFIRSLVGAAGVHDAFQCQSGFDAKNLANVGGRPAMGCVVGKLRGSAADAAPSFVDLMQGRPHVRNSARPGFLGPAFQPFRPDISALFERPLEPGMVGELSRRGDNHATSLALNAELPVERLGDRTNLLAGLDRLRKELDRSGMMEAQDSFTQQAVGILTSGKFAAAMDLSQEDPRVLERYTLASDGEPPSTTSDRPDATKKFLLARRLVEAGVRCVSISISDFDTHSSNFPRLKRLLPIVDHGLATLIADLDERGMLDDVSIVAWGEFGRTPTVDRKNGGRHHWPAVGMALLAGGGIRAGQVIGATDRYAAAAISRPVHYQDVFATLYHNLGINARATTVTDPSGRPQYLLDRGEVLPEVV